MQLKALASGLGDGTKSVVENVLRLLLNEQQRIRLFVEGRQHSTDQPEVALLPKMQQLIDLNRRQWGCDIPLAVSPDNSAIRPELANQLDFILGETIANAVRHGQASCVDVTVRKSSDRVLLHIKDNGHGLNDATGVYNGFELAVRKIGPVSLRTRIAELNGSLALSSSPDGVELRIDLPA